MFRRDKSRDTNYQNKPSLRNIPTFRGTSDPDTYCDWENKIDDMFDKHYDREKCLLAIKCFTNHAASWWNRLVKDRQFYYKQQIESWEELKQIMRNKYFPKGYYRKNERKFQQLKQGSMSVEEYYNTMRVLMNRAYIFEE
ncbi:hypothetical protein GQ457_11G025940 [Hibiscus cannabinus]